MRILLILLLAALPQWQESALAQTKVRTQTIRPPAAAANTPAESSGEPAARPSRREAAETVKSAASPSITADLSRLPLAVSRTRERILAAARSGDPRNLVAVMRANRAMPIFSLADDKDPIGYWKTNYPDSDGIEILAIVTNILEAPFVHVEKGTAQEMYVWPYFVRMSLKALTPEQKVELFRIITGPDYREMIDFDAYSFYRIGISPDGTWHFFVTGD